MHVFYRRRLVAWVADDRATTFDLLGHAVAVGDGDGVFDDLEVVATVGRDVIEASPPSRFE